MLDGLRYRQADPGVTAGWVDPAAPAAWFDGPGDTQYSVRVQDLSPWRDVSLFRTPRAHRTALVDVLCAPVTRAPLVGPKTLDLARRFEVTPDRDSVDWRLWGFQHVDTVDRKLVKHVLGLGRRPGDPDERLAWERLLGRSVDVASQLTRLENAGCSTWQDYERTATLPSLYTGLGPVARLACMDALGSLREAYMWAVRDAATAATRFATARHVHVGEGAAAELHLVDERGVWVTAKGSQDCLAAATAFVCLHPSETETGPATLRARRARLAQTVATRGAALFHTPPAWGY